MELLFRSVILVITFYILAIICDTYFVNSLEKISKHLKLSSEITGATFMAIGSSAPELFTSIFALFTIFGATKEAGTIGLGAGTIVGSALFNILVIIGASAIYMNKQKSLNPDKNKIARQPIIRDLTFYLITIALLLVSFMDGKIVFYETAILVGAYGIYIYIVKNRGKRLNYSELEEEIEEIEEGLESNSNIIKFIKKLIYRVTPKRRHKYDRLDQYIKSLEEGETHYSLNRFIINKFNYIIPNPENGKMFWWTFIVSIIIIAITSHFMVESAVHIAEILDVPKAIIGLTILAAGTSIPDLISSIIVAKKGKGDMAIANGLGSNIFDILIGIGAVYLIYLAINPGIKAIPVDTHNLNTSIILLFSTALVLLVYLAIQKRRFKEYAGYVFIGIYIIYLLVKVYQIS